MGKLGGIAEDRMRAFYCEDFGYIELRKTMPRGSIEYEWLALPPTSIAEVLSLFLADDDLEPV